MYLPQDASRARVQAAERARQNRLEIVRELSWGRVSRRDLVKWGLFTSAGLLAPIGGLSPFKSSRLFADSGIPRSPLFGAKPFTQPMPRFDVLPRIPVSQLNPAPMASSNQTQQPLHPLLGKGTGPIEGRPPGDAWAHQRFSEFPPTIAVEASQAPATTNYTYNPQVPSTLNSRIDPTQPIPLKFHPNMPVQGPQSVWTFNGTIPPKLVVAKYGEPILFRHHNQLPYDIKANGGFGRYTISTHEHNGHHGAENDGFTGAYFFPGQFYDYHWPVILGGHYSVNTGASDKRACTPDGSEHTILVPGDHCETMSTHWFHDHMFSFTSQNVYKGNAAMFNIYSGIDRGNEHITDDVNLKLPSGSAKDWGNLDYDVNLAIADKAFNSSGQLMMDIFEFDGFLGDVMTVNLAYKPYFEVERRKYRFRILNASVARFFKIALVNASGQAQQITQIGNDGNLLPQSVSLTELDEQGIAERYDIIIDFSKYLIGDKLHLVNLCEHEDGAGPKQMLSVAAALSGKSPDPCVGRFLQFTVVRNPDKPDESVIPTTMIDNPEHDQLPVARERTFLFGRGGKQTRIDEASFGGPWAIGTNGGEKFSADYGRISAAPQFGTREIWHLVNDGGGWDHPVHIHFEEGLILARNGSAANVPAWERGRKDVYRLRPNGSVTISIQFRDWGGMFMEHCHNTTHEDNAMLLRWEIDGSDSARLAPMPTPIPTPNGVKFENPYEILP